MCGRFTLTLHQLDEVIDRLDLAVDSASLESYRPRYNVAPGNTHWIVRSGEVRRELVPADWGLINSWSKDPRVAYKQINARAETLEARPAWRAAFRQRRCVVPSDGFYEWQGPKNAREPVWFHPADGGLLWLAGLYESWENDETGESRTTFTVITTEANRVVRPVHGRMPVIIAEPDIAEWVGGQEPGKLLKPIDEALIACRPVSSRVNSPKNDDPACLEPRAAAQGDAHGFGQLGLFEG